MEKETMAELNILTTIKPLTNRELADIYDVCEKTFRKWMKLHEEAIGQRQGRYYTVLQVKIIIEKLGLPYKVNHNGHGA